MSTKVKSKLKPSKPAFKKAPGVPQDKLAIAKAKNKVMEDNMNTRIGRVLRTNLESNNFGKEHLPFASRFLKSLLSEANVAPVTPEEPVDSEQNQKSPKDFTPEGDKEAFQNSLEVDTNKDEFEIPGVSPDITSQTIQEIKQWSKKLNEFAEFLNDPDENSLHKILSNGDRAGSLLRGVTRKASDSITRIAGEVEKLKEILNTYIITAPKKLAEVQPQAGQGQQNAGWTQY